ncbi:hypothetical protein HYN59_10230 [Flavobacterium album]|uniref:Uncharacterized protein n=1 Tax=Flavobacterium album TaxID=2175091 RepID=A0A2S1QYJ0_9FLAO|nr:hypothetical protein HYN59_10230 [Flavobacterium album]
MARDAEIFIKKIIWPFLPHPQPLSEGEGRSFTRTEKLTANFVLAAKGMRIFAIPVPAIRFIPPASGMPLLSGLKGIVLCA